MSEVVLVTEVLNTPVVHGMVLANKGGHAQTVSASLKPPAGTGGKQSPLHVDFHNVVFL